MMRSNLTALALLFSSGLFTGCNLDMDGDGYGAWSDCDDGRADIFPGQFELCNGVDDDCDGGTDNAPDQAPFQYRDSDGDGFGDASRYENACWPRSGWVSNAKDCDDADVGRAPGAAERCNGLDDDCDGVIDNDPIDPPYDDQDRDGFGDPARRLVNCDAFGVNNADDCDDANSERFPGAAELCDGVDTDCDGLDDESDPDAQPQNWFVDQDEDGVGTGDPLFVCLPPEGYVTETGDCDDLNHFISPSLVELCDGIDNNCDGEVDGVDAWWDLGFPARVVVKLTAPDVSVAGLPFAFDLDVQEVINHTGGVFDPTFARMKPLACGEDAWDQELPVRLYDDVQGISKRGFEVDALFNNQTAVLGIWDEDADTATKEVIPAGKEMLVALYLQGNSSRSWTSDLAVVDAGFEQGAHRIAFDSDFGALPRWFVDGAKVLDMAETLGGNGIRTPIGGLSAQDVSGVLQLVSQDDVSLAGTSSGGVGNAVASFIYDYRFRTFVGRDEMWVRPHMRTTVPSIIEGVPDRTAVLRPFQANIPADADCEVSEDLDWVSWTVDSGTMTAMWLDPDAYVTHADCGEGIAWLAANDYAACCGGEQGTILNNTDFIGYPLMVLMHSGPLANLEEERQARQQGVGVEIMSVEFAEP